MTEDEAETIIRERFGSARAERLGRFLAVVKEENSRQNLVAPSTLDTIWNRHGLDSAQLMFHVKQSGPWLDVGTGGGFPGIVLALLGDDPVAMVEPRRKRADFLQSVVDDFALSNASVHTAKVEAIVGRFATISARAVASVEKLLQAAGHCATPDTRWVLPRGRMAPEYVTQLRSDRTRLFHVEHSITDPESSILIVDSNPEGRR